MPGGAAAAEEKPVGQVRVPDAAAKPACVKNAIISTPNMPPTKWPGKSPIGSENHLNPLR